ncbi:MAG: hypothetical protein PHG82_00675 [Candidatus Gracilibacteria bacterium]|nr:hypothetical protein [Candidatus Gracilibacteria bacterium]
MKNLIFILIVTSLLAVFGVIPENDMNKSKTAKNFPSIEEVENSRDMGAEPDVEKTFWCAAISGDETVDFMVNVAGKNSKYIMSTDIGEFLLNMNATAKSLGKLVSSNPSLFIADNSVKIDDVKCQESSPEEFFAYKKSQEVNLE